MPLRSKHKTVVARRGQRPVWNSVGQTHHGRSPAKTENEFKKPWWARHRIESPGTELLEQEARGPVPNEEGILGKGLGDKAPWS